ncbi:histidinol dehydrogenase [Acuticoccus sediminis]
MTRHTPPCPPAARRAVPSRRVGIDMAAGPTDLMILADADASADPGTVAAGLVGQMERGAARARRRLGRRNGRAGPLNGSGPGRPRAAGRPARDHSHRRAMFRVLGDLF